MPRASAWRALRRGVLVPCLVWALLSVAPAWSAELVEVRVGNHPTFTRVVFEFDVATGYRVERHAEGEPDNVIVVTLDAASRPRNIVSRSPGVASVSVEAGFDRAIARISTRKPGMPIKEMILRDPPRIVLDLMLGKSAPAVVPAESAPAPSVVEPAPEPRRVAEPKPAPEPRRVAEPKPTPEPRRIAEPKPAPEPRRIAEPKPAPEVPPVAPVPKPEIAAVEPEPTAVVPEPAPAVVEPVPAREPAPAVAETEPEVVAEPVTPLESVVEERVRVADEEHAPGVEVAPGLPRSPERDAARRRPAESPLAAKVESLKELVDLKTAGAIAGGVLALILVVFLVVRRRRPLSNDLDVTKLVGEDEGAEEANDEDRIPKGGFSMEAPLGGEARPAEDFEVDDSGKVDDENKPIDSVTTGPDVATGLFDEAPHEKEATTMENQDLPITRMDSDAVTQTGAGAALVGLGEDSDITRIVQDLERRVAHLETRLDESIDARERLERQVAAQSEELRVQRAAIARTQRALRSLNRAEEEQATEPALRDPSKPVGSE
jgi:hypothetical protein